MTLRSLVRPATAFNNHDAPTRGLWRGQQGSLGLGSADDADGGVRHLWGEVQLLRDAHTAAVELAHQVCIHTGLLLPQDKVRCPDQRQRLPLHLKSRHEQSQILVDEVVHQSLELRRVRLVCHILCTRAQGGRDAALRRLLVHNLRRRVVDHVHAQLPLHNARQKALVNQLPVVPLYVLLAECQKLVHRHLLLVVVHRLLQVQQGGAGDRPVLPLLHLDHPDALALGAAVLLEDTCAGGNGGGEALLEGGDVVVGKGVAHAAGKVLDLDESILGAHALDDVRVGHDGLAGARHLLH
mmetsp:Transcript_30822/g.77215  ORF Transcript_30822/g.77215 Transcript_30822/m.77215 type:complete len:296 (-) Transcript_30822:423-1310(-)